MDLVGTPHNYRRSVWYKLAEYFDRKGWHGLGQRYWDKEIAWRNKWKNGDPKQGEAFFLSSTALSTFCDGWHTIKAIWLIHLFAAVVLYEPLLWHPFLDLCLFFTVFGAVHSIVFKWLQVEPPQ